MIGSQLEKSGWRQGSVVKPHDTEALLARMGRNTEDESVIIVASQCCDIAHHCIDSEPFIEVCIASKVASTEGNLTHGKNPRILHTKLMCRTSNESIIDVTCVEIRATEKALIPRHLLLGLQPDDDRRLDRSERRSFIAWLASRYSRPAFPTKFNDQIAHADPKGKLRAKAKKLDELCGIYAQIFPDSEVSDDQNYRVQLLGLLPSGFTGDRSKVEKALESYAGILEAAGMDVVHAVRTEDEVSVATMSNYKRFYYDDISFKNESALPVEL